MEQGNTTSLREPHLIRWMMNAALKLHDTLRQHVRHLISSAFFVITSATGLLLWSPATYAGVPVLINTTTAAATVGVPYSSNFMVGGEPAPTSVSVSGLPSGIIATHNGFGSVSLNGTPTQAGIFNLSIVATSIGGTLNTSLTLRSVDYSGYGAQSVAGGYNHSCAVVNGGVQCWGGNSSGQLGNGSTTASLVPLQSTAPGSGAAAVAVGFDHTCVVVNGGVQCWGGNVTGQLGNNSTTNSLVPVQSISADSGVTAVAAGGAQTCAVVSGGVRCWGYNANGQLGNDSTINSPMPVQSIASGSGVTAVAASGAHACAVINGGVQCWGLNNSGRLGNNSTNDSGVPVQSISAGSGVTAVAAGQYHTCAVVNGGVQCWGSNSFGQLGNNSSTTSLVPIPIIAAASGVTAIAAGDYYTCALMNGGVRCWGLNDAGQLGNNSTTNSLVPVQSIAAGGGFTAVAAGRYHTCAVVNGGVRCWGANSFGQLGNNSRINSLLPAQSIAAGSGVTTLAAGYYHTCAVLNGGVQCWGLNGLGQLGNNSVNNSLVPVQSIAASSGVPAVAAGNLHTCAVVNGGVQCWGYNYSGQLGNNSTTNSLVPVQSISAGSGVTAVTAGESHSCAVVSGGVRCWGYNVSGQLGNNSTTSSLVPVQSIAAGSGVTAVAAGNSHTCAVVNGGVRCWGSNGSGQLGNNSTINSPVPVQSIAAGSGVTAVAAVNSHTCAVVNGGVRCWGSNGAGELGNNSMINSPVPLQSIAAGSGVTVGGAGYSHTCAVVNGGVQCWGDNRYGQLTGAVTYLGQPVSAALLPASSSPPNTYNLSLQNPAAPLVAGTTATWVLLVTWPDAVVASTVGLEAQFAVPVGLAVQSVGSGCSTYTYLTPRTLSCTFFGLSASNPITINLNLYVEPTAVGQSLQIRAAVGQSTATCSNGSTGVGCVVSDSIVAVAASDDHGNVAGSATSIQPNSTTAGTIGVGGDVDWFRIVIPSGGTLVLRTTGTTDTYGELFAADGVTSVAFNDNDPAGGLNFYISYNFSAATTVFLRIRHSNSTTGTGAYTLVSTFTSSTTNGVCGSANGVGRATQPIPPAGSTGYLCAAGTATPVSGSGPWTWTCTGLAGGTNASCAAPLLIDTIAPTLSLVSATAVSTPQSTLSARSSETGRIYWLVVPTGSVAPSAVQIRSGGNYGGVVIAAAGSTPATANVSISAQMTPLSSNVDYVVYVVAEDASFNLSSVAQTTISRALTAGACGAAHRRVTESIPTANLCAAGVNTALSSSSYGWGWRCVDFGDESNAAICSATLGYTVAVAIGSNALGANGSTDPAPNTSRLLPAGSAAQVRADHANGFSKDFSGCAGTLQPDSYYRTGEISGSCTVTVNFFRQLDTAAPPSCGGANGISTASQPTSSLLCTSGQTASTPVLYPAPKSSYDWTCSNSATPPTTVLCSAPISGASTTTLAIANTTASAFAPGTGIGGASLTLNIEQRASGILTNTALQSTGKGPTVTAVAGTSYEAVCKSGVLTYTITASSSPVTLTSLPANTRFACYVREMIDGNEIARSQTVDVVTAPVLVRSQPDAVSVWRSVGHDIDVLRNDWLSSGGVADRIVSFTPPSNGSVSKVTRGAGVEQLRYVPNTGYVGADSFTYVAQDSRSGVLGTSTTVTVNVQAPFILPGVVSASRSTTVALDGAGSVEATFTRNGNGGLVVSSFARNGATVALSPRVTGRSVLSDWQFNANKFVFDAIDGGSDGVFPPAEFRQTATPTGDIVLESNTDQLSSSPNRLLTAVSDVLFTPTRRVPYGPFWKNFSEVATVSFLDAIRATADTLPDPPMKYLQEMLTSHPLGNAANAAAFPTLPTGSLALGATGDFSASDVMIGDGAKRVGLITQLQRHTSYSSRLQSPPMIAALSRLVSGASLISGSWAATSLASLQMPAMHSSMMNGYRTFGQRRTFANIVQHVREVDTSVLDGPTQVIRDAVMRDFSVEFQKLDMPSILSMMGISSAGLAADQIAMHLLKIGAQNDLLRQLTDVDGAKLLVQDLMVEMLAQGPYSSNFLRYLPTMKVYTYEPYQTNFSPSYTGFRLVETTGAARYAQLIGNGRD